MARDDNLNPDGGQGVGATVTQTRKHNLANEIDDDNVHGDPTADPTIDTIDSAAAAGNWKELIHGGAGNMICELLEV